jgi:hypothetical protein
MRRSRLPLLGLLLVAACSYDWNVPTVDAGPEARGGDGATPPLDSGASDSFMDVEASIPDSGPEAGSTDSSMLEAEAGPDCATLAANLAAARAAAVACTSSVQACMSTVLDECHCAVRVGAAGSAADAQFSSAVSAFEQAGCTPAAGCPSPCPVTAATCLVDGGGGGACYQ